MPNEKRIAYLADGRIFIKEGSSAPTELLCTYAEELRERMEKLHLQNDWKQTPSTTVAGALVWGGDAFDERRVGTSIAAIAPSENPGELLYALNTDDVAGIFRRAANQNGDETRVVHTSESNLHTLSAPDAEGQVACSISGITGLQNLCIYRHGSPGFTEITEGDSLDAAASWIPRRSGQLVYQTAGIGRDANGKWIDTAPASIAQLDIGRGEITALLSHPRYEFLSPQVNRDGQLFCLRKPHRGTDKLGLGSFIRSLIPGKPKPDRDPGDSKQWDLIRVPLANPVLSEADVIARGVEAYHLGDSGTVIYSNGTSIFGITSNSKSPVLLEEAGPVQQLVYLS